MDLNIKGKTALVCASSRGLGRGCAEALAEAGVDLVLNARGAEALEQTAEEIRNRWGVKVTTVAGDVSDEDARAAMLKVAAGVDILVNNAGGPPRACGPTGAVMISSRRWMPICWPRSR